MTQRTKFKPGETAEDGVTHSDTPSFDRDSSARFRVEPLRHHSSAEIINAFADLLKEAGRITDNNLHNLLHGRMDIIHPYTGRKATVVLAQVFYNADTPVGIGLLYMHNAVIGSVWVEVLAVDPLIHGLIEGVVSRVALEEFNAQKLYYGTRATDRTLHHKLLRRGYRLDCSESFTTCDFIFRRVIYKNLKKELVTISLRDELRRSPVRARALFKACYQLYVNSFPDPDEIEAESTLWKSLQREEPIWDIIAIYQNQTLIGARHLTLLNSNHPEIGWFAAGEHLYVDRSVRRQGYGRIIVSETEKYMKVWGIKLVISEQNDPLVMNRNQLKLDELSGITTGARLKFWHHMGYTAVDESYISPALEDGKNPVYHMKLAVKKLASDFPNQISADAYLAIVKAYQQSWISDWEQNPVAKEFKLRLKKRPQPLIPLIDLLQARSCAA